MENPYLNNTENLLKIIDNELEKYEKEKVLEGYTPWVILSALGTISWLLLNALGTNPNWHTIIYLFFTILFSVSMLRIAGISPTKTTSLEKTRFREINYFESDCNTILWGLTSDIILFAIYKICVFKTLSLYCTIPISLYFVIHITVPISIIMSRKRMRLNNTTNAIDNYIRTGLFLISAWALTGILISTLPQLLNDNNAILDLKAALLIFALYYLFGKLASAIKTPDTHSLRELKLELLFDEIDHNTAKKKLEIIMLGMKYNEAFQKDIDDNLQTMHKLIKSGEIATEKLIHAKELLIKFSQTTKKSILLEIKRDLELWDKERQSTRKIFPEFKSALKSHTIQTKSLLLINEDLKDDISEVARLLSSELDKIDEALKSRIAMENEICQLFSNSWPPLSKKIGYPNKISDFDHKNIEQNNLIPKVEQMLSILEKHKQH